jgi:lipopolysaccharide biosynthesis glycosyltransferase
VAALAGVKTAGIDTLIAADAQVNSVLIKCSITVLDGMTAGAVRASLSSALSSADAATMWLGTVIESTPKVVVRNGESPTISGEAGDEAGRTAPLTAVSPARLLDDERISAAEAGVKAAEAEAVAEAAAFANDGYRLPSVAPHAAGATPFPYPPKVPLADGEKITVVIISDRLQPLSAAIGSILMHSTVPLQIYIIAYEAGELQATLTRTLPLKPGQSLEVLAMDAVTAQLVQTSFEPVWVWDEYGESTGSGAEAWRTKHTVQQEMWDHDPMHSSPFNHLRFYLPYLPFLADVDHLIFLDDDVIVQGEIAEMVVQMPPGKAIAAPCDTWVWGDSCSQFTFVANATDWRRNSAVLYLNSAWRSCGSDEACKISAYEETIQQISRNATGKEIDLSRQPVWNFGVVMYNCTEWRRLGMTERYHTWLRADYALHLWPEDSLSYGLGIPYLAFEGVVVCWNDLIAAPFRDGMGFISVADLRVNAMSVRSYLDDAIALHWSGRNKPWGMSVLESEFLEPWERTVKQLQLGSFINERQKPERVKAIFLTEARSGSEWFMDLLDHHPEICATGDRNNPTAGFGREALLPEHYSGDGCGFRFPTCSVRLGCNWGFFAKWVPHYHLHYREWCVGGVNVPDEDTHRTHGWRLCEAARVLTERHPGAAVSFYDTDGVQRLWDLYEEHAFDDSSKIVPCSCQHQKVQMFKVMRSWFNDTEATRSTYRDAAWFSGNFDSKQVDACGAEVRSPSVDWSQYFVVEWRRRDLLAECIDTLYSDDSPVEYVSSTRADVGNIAGRWSEAWGGRPLNVSEITSCMRELKRERARAPQCAPRTRPTPSG